MGDTVTSRFIKAFDPASMKHVKWLQHITKLGDGMGDPAKQQTLTAELMENPMKVEVNHIDALDFPHIHFVLSAAYSRAVLFGKAYVPLQTLVEKP
jgi:hypothetical protein